MIDQWILGAEKFNRGEYYEAHKFWEEIWKTALGDEKEYIKCLILACGVLIHIQKENLDVATRLGLSCQKKLTKSYLFKYRIQGLENFLKFVVEGLWTEAKTEKAKLKACGVRV